MEERIDARINISGLIVSADAFRDLVKALSLDLSDISVDGNQVEGTDALSLALIEASNRDYSVVVEGTTLRGIVWNILGAAKEHSIEMRVRVAASGGRGPVRYTVSDGETHPSMTEAFQSVAISLKTLTMLKSKGIETVEDLERYLERYEDEDGFGFRVADAVDHEILPSRQP